MYGRSPLVDTIASQGNVSLRYSIAAVSSYSSVYEPANVLVNKPQDLTSRWSGFSFSAFSPSSGTQVAPSSRLSGRSASILPQGPSNGKQYIILKLEQPAVVRLILFGKFQKAHPCNLKDFKVYGGPVADPNSGMWMRLLRAGLRNDAKAEEFSLRWLDDDDMVREGSYTVESC